MLKCKVQKDYDHVHIDVDLEVKDTELTVILGASGCGKSTLLNFIAGMKMPDQGRITLGHTLFWGTDGSTPIHHRKVGYIQQQSYLFPHMTVEENMFYGVNKKEREAKRVQYEELIKLLNISELVDKKPDCLSGGQQQRVAIGRVLMMEPRILLWDEPFSALDHNLREDLRGLVLRLKRVYEIPMLFVTHDLGEAYELADTLVVMKEGKILAKGDKESLFKSPKSMEVAEILGVGNILEVTDMDVAKQRCFCGSMKVKVAESLEKVRSNCDKVYLGIRPDQVLYVRERGELEAPKSQDYEENILSAVILSIHHHLESYRLELKIKGMREHLKMDMPRGVIKRYDMEEGDQIEVLLKYKSLMLLVGEQGNEESV